MLARAKYRSNARALSLGVSFALAWYSIPSFAHAQAASAQQVAPSTQSHICDESVATITGGFGEVRFKIEVADTSSERSSGLMFREQLGALEGMLFVYDKPQSVHFWMKNTLIPLDMIFTDQAGVIMHIHENAIPHDLTAIPGGTNILTVLEINGGLSKRLGLKIGDTLHHPAYTEFAAVPCSIKNKS